MNIKWEWGYFGKCYVDGKFSHGVTLQVYDSVVHGQYWNEVPHPSGRMLGTIEHCKTLGEAVEQAQLESLRIKNEGVNTYENLKRKLHEYPFAKVGKK